MKVLVFLNDGEAGQIQRVEDVLSGKNFEIGHFFFESPFERECGQAEEIRRRVSEVEVVVYFASVENERNRCLEVALREAARINVKVICIWLGDQVRISSEFEGLGDCLVSDIGRLPDAIVGVDLDWENSDGSLKEDRPFKRYKCGGN